MPPEIPYYSTISHKNSTKTALGSGETFTGQAEHTYYPQVGVQVKTDNSGTLYFDFSIDGVNWDSTYPVNGFAVSANVSSFHTAVKLARYFRVRLVNDSGAQSYLRLETYFGLGFVQSVAPLNQTASLYQDAIFTRNSVAQDEIVIGRRSGVTSWNKFGYNTDVDSASPEVVASFGGTFTPLTTASTFTITYDGTGGGSTDGTGTNGATELTFYYVDSNGLPATAVHTLGTDGSDVTSFSGLGINRVKVTAAGSTKTNGSVITITATTGGSTQAEIPDGDGVTQQSIFHVGSNHKAIIKDLKLNIRKLAGGSAPRVTIRGWIFNRTIQIYYEVFRWDIDTAIENSLIIPDNVGITLIESDVFYFEAETNTDNTIVGARFELNEYQNT